MPLQSAELGIVWLAVEDVSLGLVLAFFLGTKWESRTFDAEAGDERGVNGSRVQVSKMWG